MNLLLTQLKPGEKGKVKQIDACRRAARRLYEMGFNIGTNFEVVKNDIGPIIVSLFGHKVAVGRGLAQKIIVNQPD
ncbi:MAG: FeoA family protein [Natronincolaceae bacterium]|nr:FeoA domain-containing protein [Bacillota bacterium]HZX21056.1 FeoA domain-containing protein [Clostridia bacterium]